MVASEDQSVSGPLDMEGSGIGVDVDMVARKSIHEVLAPSLKAYAACRSGLGRSAVPRDGGKLLLIDLASTNSTSWYWTTIRQKSVLWTIKRR
jgi:hypothetical protein